MDAGIREMHYVTWLIVFLSSGFAALATVLAAIGVYGMAAYAARRRTTEIAIRTALGAVWWKTLRMMLREAGIVTVVGIVFGLCASLSASHIISSLVFGVKAGDPVLIVVPALLVGVIAVVAALLPALRASRADPLVVLRYE